VAELAVVDGGTGSDRFLGPGEEVAHDRGAVMLRDEGDQGLGQPGPVGEVDAVGDVLLEHAGADLGVELVMDVVAAGLVLDERERVRELADVVNQRPGGKCAEPAAREPELLSHLHGAQCDASSVLLRVLVLAGEAEREGANVCPEKGLLGCDEIRAGDVADEGT